MPEAAIADTSALIALDKIGLLEILCKIYSEIILPEAVIKEFGTPDMNCYSIRKVESHLVKNPAAETAGRQSQNSNSLNRSRSFLQ